MTSAGQGSSGSPDEVPERSEVGEPAAAPKVPGQANHAEVSDRAGDTADAANPPAGRGSSTGDGRGEAPVFSVPQQRGAHRSAGPDEVDGSDADGPEADGLATDDLTASADDAVGDTELISRIRSGDTQAYDELYRRHADAVRRYARTCCRDADTADDLTGEVFARTLQAAQRGKGPNTAVRAYLLTSVRHAAAAWSKSARREHLVDDFAVFAVSAVGSRASDEDTLDLGADVRAMHQAERSMVVQAFRTLPERWQAVLWHTAVEDSSPREVAPILGLTPNATAVLAHRAREGLKQAYLQAHVSQSLTEGGDCAQYADRLGAYARGGLRTRAERGLRRHLAECARCQLAAVEVKDVNQRLAALLPVAVIGWFAAGYSAKVAGLVGGGAASATAGSAAAAGGKGGAAAEGMGAPAKAGIVASAVVAAAAATAMVLALSGSPQEREPRPPQAQPSQEVPEAPPSPSEKPEPEPRPEPTRKPPPAESEPPREEPTSPPPTPSPPTPPPTPSPTPTPTPTPSPTPTPTPTPTPPTPEPYQVRQLAWGLGGDDDEPTIKVVESSWVWQRSGPRIGGQRYEHGITVSAASSVDIALNRECTSYEAVAGVDDLTLGRGSVRFTVYGDGQRLWQSSEVSAGGPPVRLSVPLTGVETMRLEVTPSTPLGAVALTSWADSVIHCS